VSTTEHPGCDQHHSIQFGATIPIRIVFLDIRRDLVRYNREIKSSSRDARSQHALWRRRQTLVLVTRLESSELTRSQSVVVPPIGPHEMLRSEFRVHSGLYLMRALCRQTRYTCCDVV